MARSGTDFPTKSSKRGKKKNKSKKKTEFFDVEFDAEQEKKIEAARELERQKILWEAKQKRYQEKELAEARARLYKRAQEERVVTDEPRIVPLTPTKPAAKKEEIILPKSKTQLELIERAKKVAALKNAAQEELKTDLPETAQKDTVDTDDKSDAEAEISNIESEEDFSTRVQNLLALRSRIKTDQEIAANLSKTMPANNSEVKTTEVSPDFISDDFNSELIQAVSNLKQKINNALAENQLAGYDIENAKTLATCANNLVTDFSLKMSKERYADFVSNLQKIQTLSKSPLPKQITGALLIVLGIGIIVASIAAAILTGGMFTPLSIAGIAIGINILIGVAGGTLGASLLITGSIFAANAKKDVVSDKEIRADAGKLVELAKSQMPSVSP